MSLMAELGEGPDGGPPPAQQGPRAPHPGPPQQGGGGGPQSGAPPRPMRMQGQGPMMGNNSPMGRPPPHSGGGKGPRMGRHVSIQLHAARLLLESLRPMYAAIHRCLFETKTFFIKRLSHSFKRIPQSLI